MHHDDMNHVNQNGRRMNDEHRYRVVQEDSVHFFSCRYICFRCLEYNFFDVFENFFFYRIFNFSFDHYENHLTYWKGNYWLDFFEVCNTTVVCWHIHQNHCYQLIDFTVICFYRYVYFVDFENIVCHHFKCHVDGTSFETKR